MAKKRKILLIGGTEEAIQLNHMLAGRADVELVTSLAGRTRHPAPLAGEILTGGFGGVEGCEKFIADRQIDLVIDASHPFAEKITGNAFTASQKSGVDYLRYQRPAWTPKPGDRWLHAKNIEESAAAVGGFERIFLTIGRQELAPFETLPGKHFFIRSIEAVAFSPPASTVEAIQARGPFSLADETELLSAKKIGLLVSKNSGGAATYAKIEAARNLGITVMMIERPELPECLAFGSIDRLLKAAGLV